MIKITITDDDQSLQCRGKWLQYRNEGIHMSATPVTGAAAKNECESMGGELGIGAHSSQQLMQLLFNPTPSESIPRAWISPTTLLGGVNLELSTGEPTDTAHYLCTRSGLLSPLAHLQSNLPISVLPTRTFTISWPGYNINVTGESPFFVTLPHPLVFFRVLRALNTLSRDQPHPQQRQHR